MKLAGLLSETGREAHHGGLVRETAYVQDWERELKCRTNINIRKNTSGAKMESLTETVREAHALME
jgi:hypothetical protein